MLLLLRLTVQRLTYSRKIGDTASYIAHTLHVTEVNGKKISLADAYNNILE